MLNVLICRAAEERQRELESKEELARKVAQDEAHRGGLRGRLLGGQVVPASHIKRSQGGVGGRAGKHTAC